ncbi:hypothetical protein DMB68_02580 [Flavobacterium hydrophilum]|uniref:Uncharacterized protein n=1 Tax=Flavobacterium hydrophilum TaxID=2211445 RepID=A0A2V4C7M5_9FLAO|nr:hypothetical protein DMB68_02580 [Flavobacterium hydrophilum]
MIFFFLEYINNHRNKKRKTISRNNPVNNPTPILSYFFVFRSFESALPPTSVCEKTSSNLESIRRATGEKYQI